MQDHNPEVDTLPEDTISANPEAVNDTAPVKDTLFAGKFGSKDELIKGTVELARKLGSEPTADQIIEWATKSPEDIVVAYKGLERQFHTPRQPQVDTESAEIESYLNQWAEKNGFVRKDELTAKEYEERELETYFAQRPDARNRTDLIKRLASTEEFKTKSFKEVDDFITKQLGGTAKPETRPTRATSRMPDAEKSLDDIDESEFAAMIGAKGGIVPGRLKKRA